MKIQSIQIKNLFDIFDYNISFKMKENVLIVTGPNGFGKTMVLNILYNIFNKNSLFFYELVFSEIIIGLDEERRIVISKEIKNETEEALNLYFFKNEVEVDTIDWQLTIDNFIRSRPQSFTIEKISANKWFDFGIKKYFTTSALLKEYGEPSFFTKRGEENAQSHMQGNEFLDSVNVHLIREQRLLKKQRNPKSFFDSDEENITVDTIQTFADELKVTIQASLQESFQQSQELDSTYPKRLTNEKNILSKSDYETKYRQLERKQEKLKKYGLYDNVQEFLSYNDVDAKALTVYIKDLELKLGVFDQLLEKLDLFTNILNERRFTFKSIKISIKEGFYFETSKGKKLELNQLSSGEQHEVVLLYELIFKTQPGVLVLIDEPEISLHITWQKEFLSDLLKIIKIQNIQVLIATHSPSIINDRWDLVYNLEATKAQ